MAVEARLSALQRELDDLRASFQGHDLDKATHGHVDRYQPAENLPRHNHYIETGGVPIGVPLPWYGTTAPTNFILLDGSAISRTGDYAELFAAYGTTFGAGDGSTTFNVPNLKGRTIIFRDAADSSFDVIGETGGAKTATLSEAQLASHSHAVGTLDAAAEAAHTHGAGTLTTGTATGGGSIGTDAAGPNTASDNDITHDHAISGTSGAGSSHDHALSGATATTGSGSSHSILNPYIVWNAITRYR